MKKIFMTFLFVFLAIPSLSDEKIDDLVECSALYTFFSLAGPIMSTKTKLLYDAADFWIEAQMITSKQKDSVTSRENMDRISKSKNKLLQDFEKFYDNGTLFNLQKNVSIECGTPLPGEYTAEDWNCINSSIEKVSEYLNKSGMNEKLQQCEMMSQTFTYSNVRDEVVKSFRK